MKSVTYKLAIPFQPCLGPIALMHKNVPYNLEQYQRRQRFFQENQCQDVGDGQDHFSHEAIALVFNKGPIDLDDLCDQLLDHSKRARKWLWVDINKFYVYISKPNGLRRSDDPDHFDMALVNYCMSRFDPAFGLVKTAWRNDDHGHIGNFMHPVTTVVWQRNDQTTHTRAQGPLSQ